MIGYYRIGSRSFCKSSQSLLNLNEASGIDKYFSFARKRMNVHYNLKFVISTFAKSHNLLVGRYTRGRYGQVRYNRVRFYFLVEVEGQKIVAVVMKRLIFGFELGTRSFTLSDLMLQWFSTSGPWKLLKNFSVIIRYYLPRETIQKFKDLIIWLKEKTMFINYFGYDRIRTHDLPKCS